MGVGTIRRKFGKILLIICLTVGLGFFFVRTGRWAFSIDAIEVMGNNIQVIVDQKRISRNLLFFPSETFRKQILSENPWLSDVQFQKKFPHTLRIKPSLRTPVVQLQSGDRIVLLDLEGMVIANGESGVPLPKINMNIPELHVGQVLTDARVVRALSLIVLLQDLVRVRTITEYDSTYFLVKSDELNIFFPQDTPIAESIATLQTLLSGFKIKGRLPAVVDLRFDKPIIKF